MTEVSRGLHEDVSLQTLIEESVRLPQLEQPPAISVEPIDSVGSSSSNLLLQSPTQTGSDEPNPWIRKNVLTLGKLFPISSKYDQNVECINRWRRCQRLFNLTNPSRSDESNCFNRASGRMHAEQCFTTPCTRSPHTCSRSHATYAHSTQYLKEKPKSGGRARIWSKPSFVPFSSLTLF